MYLTGNASLFLYIAGYIKFSYPSKKQNGPVSKENTILARHEKQATGTFMVSLYVILLFSYFQPENVMCDTKKGNNVKLIDFGLATKLNPDEIVKVTTATAEFAAPEIVDHEPVGFFTDMWAVGVLAYVL